MADEKKRILVVEDEKDISEIIEVQLKHAGYEVTVIDDGSQALEFIQKPNIGELVDLFVLDRMLPGTSGLEICKFLRMFKATKEHPILIKDKLSAYLPIELKIKLKKDSTFGK